MVSVFVWRVLLCGCETWTLGKEENSKLLDVYMVKNEEKVIDGVSKEEVPNRIKVNITLLDTITKRKDER